MLRPAMFSTTHCKRRVIKRVSHGLSVQGNFTWSKIMDQNIYLNAQDPLSSPFRYQDPNPNLVGNLVGIYQFSSLSGKRAFERWTLGGWQINGVLRAQNGNLVATPGASSTSGGNVTPLSSPRLGNATYGRYFNTCYENAAGALVMTTPSAPGCDSTSSIPAFQQHLSFTLNNIGPYMNDVRQRFILSWTSRCSNNSNCTSLSTSRFVVSSSMSSIHLTLADLAQP